MNYEVSNLNKTHLTHKFTGEWCHYINGEYWDKVCFSFWEMKHNRKDKRSFMFTIRYKNIEKKTYKLTQLGEVLNNTPKFNNE